MGEGGVRGGLWHSWKMSPALLHHLWLTLPRETVSSTARYLVVSLVKRKTATTTTTTEFSNHSSNLCLKKRKGQEKKPLLVPLFIFNGSVFSLSFKKKEFFSGEWETEIKSLWRLDSSTLPCVSFRALERLNQWRRQLDSSGGRAAGGQPSVSLWVVADRSVS